MRKRETQSEKRKTKTQNLKTFLVLSLSFTLCVFSFSLAFAQDGDLEYSLDLNSNTIALPKIFKPGIDLSGRGFHRDAAWPQTLAAKEVIDTWQKDIGFSGVYRLQYNLWEINELSEDKASEDRMLANYESVIKNISEAGGIVILDIFSTPAGFGKVLDKKSPPKDLRAFKALVKSAIRELSCKKRYNVWYEVWNAPDLEDFFLGTKQEYFNLYRVVAESILELRSETKIHIPLGAPSVTWWFQNFEGNTIITPENSLIYELIKFCYRYRLPLDFITWHGYSSNPSAEKEITLYNKTAVTLIRDWLGFFKFDRNTPLIIDEWNFDRNVNILAERKNKAHIASSFIPARLKNMYEAGVSYQTYFCLEDFANNKEGIARNVGIFSFEPGSNEYKGAPKSIYNVFRMLSKLGKDMYLQKFDDDFSGVIATKEDGTFTLLFYNYIDTDSVINYLSKTIVTLNKAERKFILNIIESQKLEQIMARKINIGSLKATGKVKNILKKALELNDKAAKFNSSGRSIKLKIKGLNGEYLYSKFAADSSCNSNCAFKPQEEKEIPAADTFEDVLEMSPNSVNMIILTKKPQAPENFPPLELDLLTSDEMQFPLGGQDKKEDISTQTEQAPVNLPE